MGNELKRLNGKRSMFTALEKTRREASAQTVIFRFSLGWWSFQCEEAGVFGPGGCFAAIFARQLAQISSRRSNEFLTDRRTSSRSQPRRSTPNRESRIELSAPRVSGSSPVTISPLQNFAQSPTASSSTSIIPSPNLEKSHHQTTTSVHSLPDSSPTQRSCMLAIRPCLPAPFRVC